MLGHYSEFLQRTQSDYRIKMQDRQLPLCDRYKTDPDAAIVVDSASTSSDNINASYPLGTAVRFCEQSPITMPVGVHYAVGGNSDQPTPGDILCGAIASCLDSTIRIVANRVGVKLKKLEVAATGQVDVRGTLRVDRNVPVAFSRFDVTVTLKVRGFVPGKLLDKMLRAAEQSCIVIQTLKHGPEITVTRN